MRIENATVADSIRVTQRGTQLWRECAPMTEQVRLHVCLQKYIGCKKASFVELFLLFINAFVCVCVF